MANNTSPHILSTSANLLGFCLIVITSLHMSSYSEKSFVDEFTSIIAVLLVFSCLFSFFSMRTKNRHFGEKFENIADYFFFGSLVGILGIILLIAFHFI